MPIRTIPPEALTYYVGLGPGRSYQKVAEKYGVTKRAVVNVAKRDRWQQQVEELERTAHEDAREKMKSTLEATYEQHMRALRLVFAKGVEALKSMAINTPADAMKAIQLAIREQRVALGEPTDRTALSIEDTIRREYERWMTVAEPEEEAPGEDENSGSGPELSPR